MFHDCGHELLFSQLGDAYCIECRVAVVLGPDDRRWWERAKCRGVDPDLFFPSRGDSGREALAVCAECPVQPQCLQYALDNGERLGIWGGTTGKQRRKMRRPRKACASCSTRFRPTQSNARYCSDSCRRLGRARTHAESNRRRANDA